MSNTKCNVGDTVKLDRDQDLEETLSFENVDWDAVYTITRVTPLT